MHLSKIEITNFRQLKEFSLTLNKNLNLLVGENNAGKTAV
jgi:putative ATP-dependent endonuclease of OLD family